MESRPWHRKNCQLEGQYVDQAGVKSVKSGVKVPDRRSESGVKSRVKSGVKSGVKTGVKSGRNRVVQTFSPSQTGFLNIPSIVAPLDPRTHILV
jgi:hypothetical protein